MGLFRVPSADPLYTSSTSYGTNANPLVGGSHYRSSTEELKSLRESQEVYDALLALELQYAQEMAAIKQSEEAKTLAESTEITDTEEITTLEETENIEEASSEANPEEISSTKEQTSTNPIENTFQNPLTSLIQETKPSQIENNILNNRINVVSNPYENNTLQLSGSNASIDYENSINFASVTADYKLQFSEEGKTALKDLQNLTSKEKILQRDLSKVVDGMIPVSAATLFDFATPMNPNNNQPKIIDRFVKSLQKLTNSRSYGEEGNG